MKFVKENLRQMMKNKGITGTHTFQVTQSVNVEKNNIILECKTDTWVARIPFTPLFAESCKLPEGNFELRVSVDIHKEIIDSLPDYETAHDEFLVSLLDAKIEKLKSTIRVCTHANTVAIQNGYVPVLDLSQVESDLDNYRQLREDWNNR